jgi:hypothetical protein
MNEFNCVKECPSMEVINSLSKFELDGKTCDFKYVYSFVNREYTERARTLFKKTVIDYIGLLDYIEKNRNIPYSNPESAVNAIIPYYEYVIGVKENEYWPSLVEYDPGIEESESGRTIETAIPDRNSC